MEALASYLLYRLNVLNPVCKSHLQFHGLLDLHISISADHHDGLFKAPAYLQLLPHGTQPITDIHGFLTLLAQRMGMIRRGAEVDLGRAAVYFVKWWREEGGLISASSALQMGDSGSFEATTQGWGFDFQWQVGPEEFSTGKTNGQIVQDKMENCIDEHLATLEQEAGEENNMSPTQLKKKMVLEEKAKRKLKSEKRWAASR